MTSDTPRQITREEFVAAYATRSGTTVEHLLTVRRPIPCDCGGPTCEGWAMVPLREQEP